MFESTGAIEIHDGAAHFPGDAYLQFPHIPLDNRPFSFAVWIRPEGKIVGYGLLEQSGARLRLTARGVMLSNEVFQEFVGVHA